MELCVREIVGLARTVARALLVGSEKDGEGEKEREEAKGAKSMTPGTEFNSGRTSEWIGLIDEEQRDPFPVSSRLLYYDSGRIKWRASGEQVIHRGQTRTVANSIGQTGARARARAPT